MANEVSNRFKFQLVNKEIDLDADTFKIALMATGFVFNRDTHATWSDVSGSELAAGNGYTAGGGTLGTSTVTEDDTNDRASVTWPNFTFTASGGSIGPSPAAIIYDDTVTEKTIVGVIDGGSDQTATDGNTFEVQNIEYRLT